MSFSIRGEYVTMSYVTMGEMTMGQMGINHLVCECSFRFCGMFDSDV
jgi:hypothetical protein